jgi:ABC-type glucose/galactose transport system permease subunit
MFTMMLIGIMLSGTMLSGAMLSVIQLTVVAPLWPFVKKDPYFPFIIKGFSLRDNRAK